MRKQTKKLLIPFAAAVFTIGASMISFAATGWQEESGSWRYYTSGGEIVTEAWKKSGNHWFWLDEDGYMATDMLVEDNDKYYYVNEAGARVANEWRELDNDDDGDDASDTCWYYFTANGSAYQAATSGKTTFRSIGNAAGQVKKYAFDSDGRMLYGWVNEDSERVTGEDAWKEATYYLGEPGDGEQAKNVWAKIEVEDDESEQEDFDGYYWFYFSSNGKKVTDTTKTINGRKYRFEEAGNAVFNWFDNASASNASNSNIYYNQPDQCWQADGWFYTVPGEHIDQEAYDNDDAYWFYSLKSGELVTSQIKKINGYYYAFDNNGKMLHGLYRLEVDGNDIISFEEIENENELPQPGDAGEVYYFGDSPKEGVMKTGTATIEIDGEKYSYNFRKSGSERGQGYDGIHDGSIYIKGRLMKADSDEKLSVVEVEGESYLVNTSGKIQKKKTNVKDADDKYYCTDSSGIVTYSGYEKWVK